MSFMWKPKTSSSHSTSAAGAPLSSVLGGFTDGQVASIQFNGGCCPGGIKGQRHWRVLLLFVQLVIYSCASHKVNHPLSHTVTLLFHPIREQSGAGLFIFNQLLYNQKNQISPSRKHQLLTPWFIWHLHVPLCCTINTWKKVWHRAEEIHILPPHTFLVAVHCYYLQPICLKASVFPPSSTINLAQHVGTFVTHFFLTPLSRITSYKNSPATAYRITVPAQM